MFFLGFDCAVCGRTYKQYSSLWRHRKYECQKESTFRCNFCSYSPKLKSNLVRHLTMKHGEKLNKK